MGARLITNRQDADASRCELEELVRDERNALLAHAELEIDGTPRAGRARRQLDHGARVAGLDDGRAARRVRNAPHDDADALEVGAVYEAPNRHEHLPSTRSNGVSRGHMGEGR